MITHNGCALLSLITHNCYALLFIITYCRETATRADTYVPGIYSRERYKRTYQVNFHLILNENYYRDVPYNLTFYPPNMNKEWGRKQGTRFQEEMDYRNPDSPPRCAFKLRLFKPTMIHSLNPKSSQPKVCARSNRDDKNLIAYKLVSDKYVSFLPDTTTSYPMKNCFNGRRFQKHFSFKGMESSFIRLQ
ncbi:hypothetical protein M9H77_28069 [Catharanthus roseus]|uniref:Uncharacterized protein n=1 Tax=Catharanthus roseus TaxID=4058 RepID=A0ACC0AEY0_CATRO|nr:hypothetical protein M9H77_28069 [Catharanthus roseus]